MSTVPEYVNTISNIESGKRSDRIARYNTAATSLALIGAMNMLPGIIASVTQEFFYLNMEADMWPVYICYGLLFLPLTFLAFDGIRTALQVGLGVYLADGILFTMNSITTDQVNPLSIAIRTLLIVAIGQGAFVRLPHRRHGGHHAG
jgi:hypothetical protein